MAEQVELEEIIDEDYEPTSEEIQDYFQVLGLDWDEDQDLRWIARDALKAPLPENWKPCEDTASKEIYYFNFKTGESLWDHPMDGHFIELAKTEREKKAKAKGKPSDGRSKSSPSRRDAPPPAATAQGAFPLTVVHNSPSHLTLVNKTSCGYRSSKQFGGGKVVDFADLMSSDDDEGDDELFNRSDSRRSSGRDDQDLDFDSHGGRDDDDDDVEEPVMRVPHVSGSLDADLNDDLSADSRDANEEENLNIDQELRVLKTEQRQRLDELKRRLATEEQQQRQELTDAHAATIAKLKQELAVKLEEARRQAEQDSDAELARLKEVGNQRQQLDDELKALRTEHEKQAALLDDARQQLRADQAQLEQDKTKWQQEADELRKQHEDELKSTREDHAKALADLKAANDKELALLREQQSALREQVEASNSDLEAQLKTQKETLSKEHAQRMSEERDRLVSVHDKAMEAMRKQLSELHATERTEIEDEIAAAKAKEEALAQLETELEQERKERRAASQAEQEQELVTLREEFEQRRAEETRQLEQDIAEAKTQLESELKTLKSKHTTERSALEERMATELTQREQELRQEGEARIKHLQNEISDMESACLEDLQAAQQRRRDLQANEQEELSTLDGELEDKREELERINNELDEAQQDVIKLQEQLADTRQECEEAAAELQRRRDELAAPPPSAKPAQPRQSVPSPKDPAAPAPGAAAEAPASAANAVSAPSAGTGASVKATAPDVQKSDMAEVDARMSALLSSLNQHLNQSGSGDNAPRAAVSRSAQADDTAADTSVREEALLDRARRFLVNQQQALHERSADLTNLRSTLATDRLDELPAHEILGRLKRYVDVEETSLQNHEALLDASARLLDAQAELGAGAAASLSAARSYRPDASYMPAVGGPIDRGITSILDEVRASREHRQALKQRPHGNESLASIPHRTTLRSERIAGSSFMAPRVDPTLRTSTLIPPSTSAPYRRVLPTQPSLSASTNYSRNLVNEHRLWLDSYRNDVSRMNATSRSLLRTSAAPLQFGIDRHGDVRPLNSTQLS